jgi:hypothetical protein
LSLAQVEFLGHYLYDDAFYVEMEQVLRLNTTLMDLTLPCGFGESSDSCASYLRMITAVGVNTTLKNVELCIAEDDNRTIWEAMRSLLETISTLESICLVVSAALPVSESNVLNLLSENLPFLRPLLNRAGRRYLKHNPSSISASIGVLAAVSDDLDCLLLHLLEDPSICGTGSARSV